MTCDILKVARVNSGDRFLDCRKVCLTTGVCPLVKDEEVFSRRETPHLKTDDERRNFILHCDRCERDFLFTVATDRPGPINIHDALAVLVNGETDGDLYLAKAGQTGTPCREGFGHRKVIKLIRPV